MRISADFLRRGSNATPEEAATVARLRILVGGKNAADARVRGRGSVDHIVVPAYPLAEGLAYKWWTLAYGRGRTTNLRSMRAGFALPDILITGIGNGLVDVRCAPYVYRNP